MASSSWALFEHCPNHPDATLSLLCVSCGYVPCCVQCTQHHGTDAHAHTHAHDQQTGHSHVGKNHRIRVALRGVSYPQMSADFAAVGVAASAAHPAILSHVAHDAPADSDDESAGSHTSDPDDPAEHHSGDADAGSVGGATGSVSLPVMWSAQH